MRPGVDAILIGPKSFEAEIQGESEHYLLINSWQDVTSQKIATYLSSQCDSNRIFLPTAFPDVSIPPSTAISVDQTLRPAIPTCAEQLRNAQVIVVLETSDETAADKNSLIEKVVSFVHNFGEHHDVRFGVVNYGTNAEVVSDIGNYDNLVELEEEIRDMHFVGGHDDAGLALKTALDLFREQKSPKRTMKIVVHAYKTDFT